MRPSAEHTILISPIGGADAEALRGVGEEIRRVFGYATEVACLFDDVEFALNPDRGQYYSTPILERLAKLAPVHAVRVVALTKVDLFIPILTHVYGEAQLGGRACIVSTCRLTENLPLLNRDEVFVLRVAKEAVHELGHTFDLRHCKDPSCIMHYCRSVADVDRKSRALCRYCGVLLQDRLGKVEGRRGERKWPRPTGG